MKKRRFTPILLALCLSASLLPHTVVRAAEETASEETADAPAPADSSVVTTNAIPGWPQAGDIASTAAIVMEPSTNTVFYSKNVNQALYPSGAVKIMTCLLALENSQLSDEVTMTATGVSGVTDGGAHISAQLDEVFTMEQCLYAIMISSANDIALQVAEHVGGSVDAFVEMMNKRAEELGCKDTVFTNPTGLPDENQHTTARDMALIMKEAISNDVFCTISRASSYTIPATNVSGGARTLTGNFDMIDSSKAGYYESCIGGKESYTQASGSTLVCAAKKNDMTLLCVILRGAADQTVLEAGSLLDYGFDNFGLLTLEDTDFNRISGGTVAVPNGTAVKDLTEKDTEKKGKIRRKYFFGETKVGSAVLEAQDEEDTAVVTGKKNMEEAQKFSASRTETPYYVIAGIGGVFLLLALYLIIRVAKS